MGLLPGMGGRAVWYPSCGDRVLGGEERSLSIHAAACLLEYLPDEAKELDPDPDCAWHTGGALFDRIEPTRPSGSSETSGRQPPRGGPQADP